MLILFVLLKINSYICTNKKKKIMRTKTAIENEITLIDTYNVNYKDYYEDFKQYCEDCGFELHGEEDNMEGLYIGGKVTFYDWISRQIGNEADDFWNDLRLVKKSPYIDYYVVTGSLGLWNGVRSGICHTFDNLYDALSKCSTDAYDIICKCDGKKIDFDCMHHDGTNSFVIYRLSPDDYDKLEYWDDSEDGNVFEFIEKHAQPITYEMLGR